MDRMPPGGAFSPDLLGAITIRAGRARPGSDVACPFVTSSMKDLADASTVVGGVADDRLDLTPSSTATARQEGAGHERTLG